MRDYIKEQLNEIQSKEEGQLNEIDLSSALGNLKNRLTSKNNKQNKAFAKILSDQFEGDFAKYLKKYLIKKGKKMDTIQTVIDYFQNPSEDNYEEVFHVIGVPMLQYFVKKTFGKSDLRGRIKQMTPFLKKVSTGNKDLDANVFLAMSHAIGEKEIEDEFKKKLRGIIDQKLGDSLEDQDFFDFISDLIHDNDDDEEELEEGIGDVVKRVKKGAKAVKRGARNIVADKIDRFRWKAMDVITDTIPSLKKKVKRLIKNQVWNLTYQELRKIIKGDGADVLSKVIGKSIMAYVIGHARSLYFKEDYLSTLTDIVEKVFMDGEVMKEVEKGVWEYYMDNKHTLEKAKEDEDIRKKYRQYKKKYQKYKKNLKK
jgi:hypothetical protein